MKQHEATQKTIDGNTFYIRPFPAFKCANISGEVFSFVMPIASSLIPTIAGVISDRVSKTNLADIDAETIAPSLVSASATMNGDKVENMLKRLLIQYKNISVEREGEDEARPLTEDIANELFCCDLLGMFILAYEVILVNFPGIFKSLENRFGKVIKKLMSTLEETGASENTESST